MTVAPIGFEGVGCAPGALRLPAPSPDMPIDTYLSTLPPEHREAVNRSREGKVLTSEDGDRFLKIVYWLTWSPMRESDKDALTLELLRAFRAAQQWAPAG